MLTFVKNKYKILAAVLALAIPLVQTGAVFAQKVSVSSNLLAISENTFQNVQLRLDAPIICPGGAPTCEVDVTFTSSDPTHISFSPSTVVWLSSEWSQTRTLKVTVTSDGIYNSGASITAHATAVSNSVYYSGFAVNLNLQIANTDPIPPIPGIVDKTIDVAANSTTTVDVLTGASGDPDSSTLAIVTAPAHGTAVDPPSTITYTPASNFVGTDSLTYQVCSLFGPSVCGTAHLNFNVIAAPVALVTPVTAISSPNTGYGSYRQPNTWLTLASITLLGSGLAVHALARRKYTRG